MPSTHKTPFLNLNQWLGSDKPKREDFCSDNLNLDNGVKNHVQNTGVHITPAERTAWLTGIFELGSYTGNMTTTRAIALGYRPRLVFLWTAQRPFCEYKAAVETSNVYTAIGCALGCTQGIALSATGFTVENAPGTNIAGSTSALNQNGKTYVYATWR